MKNILILPLLVLGSICNAQPTKNHVSLQVSAGAAQLRYIPNFIWGGYFKAGASYYITNNLSINFSVDHGISNNYPKGLSIVPNSSVEGEQQFINRYIGISKSDWYNGKTSFQYNSNTTFGLSLQNNFWLGKTKSWAIAPKLGAAYFNNRYFQTYLGTAYFTNDLLTSGKVNYRIEFNNFIGFQYGMQLTKKIKQNHRIFLEIIGESDNGASQKSYSAFKVGVGYAVVL